MAPTNELSGFRIAALLDNYFEQVELSGPKAAFENAGARVDIISRNPQPQGMNHHEPGATFHTDVPLAEARAENYDALLLPGGVANGDSLRIVPEAQRFAKAMVQGDKPVA
ncbi:MAG TPA: DJ-1/PfpI family protein, partial [Terriglobales bacterium]|nr:DJ-1/PfpI family protein [Terriglobales bacterium]